MRLSGFIQNTLYEIALGVELGRARAKDLMAINPAMLDGQGITERSYIDFDVSVVVNEERASTTTGAGKLGVEIKVATVFSASVGGDAGREASTSTSSERTHRVAFKVPVHMNASYADNPAAAANAAWLLKQHGVDS